MRPIPRPQSRSRASNSVAEPPGRQLRRCRPSIGAPVRLQQYENDLDNFRLMMRVRSRNDPYALPVPPDDDTFVVASAVCNLAVDIMEGRDGFRALADVGRKVLAGRERRGRHSAFVASDGDLPYWADFFLRKIREDFPNVEVAYARGSYARTRRFPWNGDPRNYHPKMACSLCLSGDVSEPPANRDCFGGLARLIYPYST